MSLTPHSDHRAVRRADWIFLPILLAIFFFLALGTYTHAGEDAFISFRYTRNLVRGWGLVYNRGEFVEGYSNLLWVLIMVPFEWLGVPLAFAARLVSTFFFSALVVCAWSAARRIPGSEQSRWLAWWLPAALAFEPLLHYHDDRGLETVPYAVLLGAALLLLAARTPVWIAGLCAGLAVIMRPEGIGFAVALAPAVLLYRQPDWRMFRDTRAWRDAAVYLAIPAAFFIGQLVFRKLYHGSWIPNTMVAKRPAGGGIGEIQALVASHAFVPLLGLAGGLWSLFPRRHRCLAIGVVSLWVAAAVFQIKAGTLLNVGFRYLIPIVIPSIVGTWLLVLRTAEVLGYDERDHSAGIILMPMALGLFLLVPVLVYMPGSRLFRGNTDAPRSRLHVRLFEAETYDLPTRFAWFTHEPIFTNSEAGRWAANNLPADALLAGDQMGQFGYFAGKDQTIIDLLGLMDAHVARNGLSAAYILERKPDHLIVESCLDTTYWPRDWRLTPHVPAVRTVFSEPVFRENYRARWLIRPPWSFAQVGYLVYTRRDLDDGAPLETVWNGVNEEEFDRAWRISE